MSIGLIAVVHNEARRIEQFIGSARWVCTEMVIVDQASTDGTARIAAEMGANVIYDDHHGYPEPSLALAESHITAPWVLRLDCDEYIPQPRRQWVTMVPETNADWAQLARTTWVGGDVIERDVWHIRMWKRGFVEHGTQLHQPSLPPGYPQLQGERLTSPPGTIYHVKTLVEQHEDNANYERLMGAGVKVGWN